MRPLSTAKMLPYSLSPRERAGVRGVALSGMRSVKKTARLRRPLTLTLSRGEREPERTRRHRGFTLLEVILASIITALIAAALFASLSIAFKTRQQAEDTLRGSAEVRSALDVIRRDLNSVPRPTGLLAGPMVGVDSFVGTGNDADYLAYSTPSITPLGEDELGTDMEQVVLFLAEDPDDPAMNVLVRSATRNAFATIEQPGTQRILARRVVSMNLRYYDGTNWLDRWDSTQQQDELPLAVELVLTTRPEQRKSEDEMNRDELEEAERRIAVMIPLPSSRLVPSGTAGSAGLIGF